jgi:MSHA pilin protein MshA
MRKQQSGFTLIELIVVIVILGILAATALPKFSDMSGEAKQAKADGVAGAVASSGAVQYAASLVKSGVTYTVTNACAGGYLEGAAFPTGCSGSSTTSPCSITCDTKTASASVPTP